MQARIVAGVVLLVYCWAWCPLAASEDFCNPKLCINVKHIACGGGERQTNCTGERKEIPMTDEMKAHLINLHNKVRSRVASGGYRPLFRKATRMLTLKWDQTLADLALLHAMQACAIETDGCRNTHVYRQAGQNVVSTLDEGYHFLPEIDPIQPINHLFNKWSIVGDSVESMSEIWLNKGDTVRNIDDPGLKRFGQFMQIICDRNEVVGCAMVQFNDHITRLTCNYGASNVYALKVYQAGPACIQCPTPDWNDDCSEEWPGLCALSAGGGVRASLKLVASSVMVAAVVVVLVAGRGFGV